MNNKRRKLLRKAITLLSEAENYISQAVDEERDCMENVPEGLNEGERYERMETAVDNLESASEDLGSIIESIEEAMG